MCLGGGASKNAVFMVKCDFKPQFTLIKSLLNIGGTIIKHYYKYIK